MIRELFLSTLVLCPPSVVLLRAVGGCWVMWGDVHSRRRLLTAYTALRVMLGMQAFDLDPGSLALPHLTHHGMQNPSREEAEASPGSCS